MPIYRFGRTTFSDHVWINGGNTFSRIDFVEVDMRSTGDIRLEVYNDNCGFIAGRTDSNDHGGWHTFDWSSGMSPPPGSQACRLKLISAHGGNRIVHGGAVHYG